jgi:hypothetical protein
MSMPRFPMVIHLASPVARRGDISEIERVKHDNLYENGVQIPMRAHDAFTPKLCSVWNVRPFSTLNFNRG